MEKTRDADMRASLSTMWASLRCEILGPGRWLWKRKLWYYAKTFAEQYLRNVALKLGVGVAYFIGGEEWFDNAVCWLTGFP